MPIYEYECQKCNHKFDMMHKVIDYPAVVCPQCSENNVERLVSAAGFQLKGQGWYATDFKNKGKNPQQPVKDNPEVTKAVDSEKKTSVDSSSNATVNKKSEK